MAPSTTTRYFSSCPSDPTSQWTPCPPGNRERGRCRSALAVSGFRLRARSGFSIPSSSPRPARRYPRVRIWRPSSERQRDLNPPELRAAQRTLRTHPPSCPAEPGCHRRPLGLPTHRAGLPMLQRPSPCIHATANTPVRPSRALPRSTPATMSAFPASTGRSARTSPFSRRAQRSLTLRPACSPNHHVTLYTEGFSHFVTSMTAPVASGGSKIAGWDSHPQERRRLSWRTSNSGDPARLLGVAGRPTWPPSTACWG